MFGNFLPFSGTQFGGNTYMNPGGQTYGGGMHDYLYSYASPTGQRWAEEPHRLHSEANFTGLPREVPRILSSPAQTTRASPQRVRTVGAGPEYFIPTSGIHASGSLRSTGSSSSGRIQASLPPRSHTHQQQQHHHHQPRTSAPPTNPSLSSWEGLMQAMTAHRDAEISQMHEHIRELEKKVTVAEKGAMQPSVEHHNEIHSVKEAYEALMAENVTQTDRLGRMEAENQSLKQKLEELEVRHRETARQQAQQPVPSAQPVGPTALESELKKQIARLAEELKVARQEAAAGGTGGGMMVGGAGGSGGLQATSGTGGLRKDAFALPYEVAPGIEVSPKTPFCFFLAQLMNTRPLSPVGVEVISSGDLYLYRPNPQALSKVIHACKLAAKRRGRMPDFDLRYRRVLHQAAETYFSQNWHNLDVLTESNKQAHEQLQQIMPRSQDTLTTPLLNTSQLSDLEHAVLFVMTPTRKYYEELDPIWREVSKEQAAKNTDLAFFSINAFTQAAFLSELDISEWPALCFCKGGKVTAVYQEKYCVADINQWIGVKMGTVNEMNVGGFVKKGPGKRGGGELWMSLKSDLTLKSKAANIHREFRSSVAQLAQLGAKSSRVDGDPPTIIFLGGGMGAGKSTAVAAMKRWPFWKAHGDSVVTVEADALKMTDPAFQYLLDKELGSKAAVTIHGRSTATAEQLFLLAVNKGLDVVFDGTLSWFPFVKQTVEMARDPAAYERGPGYRKEANGTVTEQYWKRTSDRKQLTRPYRLILVGVGTRPEVAVRRGVLRTLVTGRGVPVEGQLRSFKMFAENFPKYIDLFDKIVLFDNSGERLDLDGDPPVIAEKKEGGILVPDEKEYPRFLHTKDLDTKAASAQTLYPSD